MAGENSKVTFSYDQHKDAWSWVLIAKDRCCWGMDWEPQVAHIPSDLLVEIQKNSETKAIELVENHLKNNRYQPFKQKIIESEIEALKISWQFVEKKYFEILESITNKSIYQKEFPALITTGFMCPYSTDDSPSWFMISIWRSIPDSITTIAHEIFHLQYLHYWGIEVEKKLGKEKSEDLKEALTFLLDEDEFDKIILCEDGGYPDHLELRKKLSKFWQSKKNFQELVDFGVDLLQKN